MCRMERPEDETKFDALYITAGLSVKEILKEIDEDRLSIEEVPEFFKEDLVEEIEKENLNKNDIPIGLKEKFDL